MSADRLVNASDRIIVARYLDGTPHVIPVTSTADGLPLGSVTEIIRSFKAIESLKGETQADETIYIAVTAGHTEELVNGRSKFHAYEVIPLSPGQEYVLFLKAFPRRPEYPAQYGELVWARTGESGIAVTKGGLVFLGGGDPYLYAFDKATGAELWRGATPYPTNANPMTYRTPSGRQFAVIATGRGTDAALIAFALPGQ